MSVADIIASFLAFGILHMGGFQGQAGWRWLFLIEGLITLAVGILSFGMMPGRDPTFVANVSISHKY
jgi:MFS family permease